MDSNLIGNYYPNFTGDKDVNKGIYKGTAGGKEISEVDWEKKIAGEDGSN